MDNTTKNKGAPTHGTPPTPRVNYTDILTSLVLYVYLVTLLILVAHIGGLL